VAANPVKCQCPPGYNVSNASLLGASYCRACPRGFTTNNLTHSTACYRCPTSPFLTDPQYETAVNRSTGLQFHMSTTLEEASSGSFPNICVDAVVYFERVRDRGNKYIEMTSFFRILTPGLADKRDILSVWRAPMEQTKGLCNGVRSLLSCTKGAYKLTRQLAWAYTSSESDEDFENAASAYRRPGANAKDHYSFRFSFPSAGTGPYFLSLFSHKLQRVIAQIDYVPERVGDCYPEQPDVLLCEFPEDIFNFQMYGPLSPCPAGSNTDFDQLTGCLGCLPGTYAAVAGMPSCLPCPEGTYSEASWATGCAACPSGMTTATAGTIWGYDCISCMTLAERRGVPIRNVPGCRDFVMTTTRPAIVTTTPQSTPPVTTPEPIIEICNDGILTYSENCDPGPMQQGYYMTVLSWSQLQNLTDLVYKGMCSASSCRFTNNRCGDSVRASNLTFMVNSSHRAIGGPNNRSFFIFAEGCDDGNTVSGDGCSSECTIEKGWVCSFSRPDRCTRRCGNGRRELDNDEECDDGNSLNLDGCSGPYALFWLIPVPHSLACCPVLHANLCIPAENCTIECGFYCSEEEERSECESQCGDGIVSSAEECDMGGLISEACISCTIPIGFACTDAPCVPGVSANQSCGNVCGDGLISGKEECDESYLNYDTNICTSNCTLNIHKQVCVGKGCPVSESLLLQRLRKPQDLTNMNILQFMNSSSEGVRIAREGVFIYTDVAMTDAKPGAAGSKQVQSMATAGYMFFADRYVDRNASSFILMDLQATATPFSVSMVAADSKPNLFSVAATFDCPSCLDGLEIPIHQGIMMDSLRKVTYTSRCLVVFRPYQLYFGPQQVLTFYFEKLDLRSPDSSFNFYDVKNEMLVAHIQGPFYAEHMTLQALAPCNVTIINGATWRNLSRASHTSDTSGEDITMYYSMHWSTRRGLATDWETGVTGHRDCLDYCPKKNLQECYQRCLQPRRSGHASTPAWRRKSRALHQVLDGTVRETNESLSGDASIEHFAGTHPSHEMKEGAPLQAAGEAQVRSASGDDHNQLQKDQEPESSRPENQPWKESGRASSQKSSVGPGSGISGSTDAADVRANNGLKVDMQDGVPQLVLGASALIDSQDSCDFSQKPQTLMFPMERVQDEVLSPIQGGWEGTCRSSTRCPPGVQCIITDDPSAYQSGTCNVAVYINGSTLIRHVWGCPHTPWREGMATGVILAVEKGKQVISFQTNAAVLRYDEFQIIWTQTSADLPLDVRRWGVFSMGATMPQRSAVQPGMRMQIMFGPGHEDSLPKPAAEEQEGVIISVWEVRAYCIMSMIDGWICLICGSVSEAFKRLRNSTI
jgi:cysteine-rich repeat protein